MIFRLVVPALAFVLLFLAARSQVSGQARQPGCPPIIPIDKNHRAAPGRRQALVPAPADDPPVVPIVVMVRMYNMTSKSFGKEEGVTASMILPGGVFGPIPGVGSARYIGSCGDRAAFQARQRPLDFDKAAR
ncbi:DUF5684 domain-containing protein [Flaviaesturariibacter amylovorans]|uniref:Uncharacterized protein n=1 Tax=Flaviaesturariibacter amylovorans TaxID=1084520 RepID=A0ABP8GG40_9BACT